jgi:hypothetical protein
MADHKYQLPDLFETVPSGRSAILRILGYTALAGIATWFAMKGGEIPLTNYNVTGIADRMNGVSHSSTPANDSDEAIEKLRRRYAEDMKKAHPQSEQKAQNLSAAPREARKDTLPIIATILVSVLTFFTMIRPKKKQGQDAQLDQIDITKIRRR